MLELVCWNHTMTGKLCADRRFVAMALSPRDRRHNMASWDGAPEGQTFRAVPVGTLVVDMDRTTYARRSHRHPDYL
jgi:hypothetical protein